MKRKTWVVSAGVLVLAAAGTFLYLRGSKEEIHWRSAKVDRGSVTQRISATGTLNALIQVPVGTQVSGVVVSLTADFNSLVKKGQVIGQIDPTPWLTNLKDAQAGLQRAEAALAFAKVDFKRAQELWNNKLLDDSDLDTKDLALKTAAGNLESAKATLANAQTNLGYCTIKAPVDGVVVSRLVDVGQTVAASFTTPSVFTIAQDLSRMKVQAAIDEADIGQVRVGQPAYFTVDSYPDKQFKGLVSEVQLNPIITNNVVTYNVVMEVANEPRAAYAPGAESGAGRPRGGTGQAPAGAARARTGGAGSAAGHPAAQDPAANLEYTTARYIPVGSPVYKGDLALFPGMTANCTIITNRRDDALRVPSSALRFNPAAFVTLDKTAAAPQAGAGQHPAGAGSASTSPAGSGGAARGLVARRDDRLWVLVNGKPKAIAVRAGVSDGTYTELRGDDVAEGTMVLTGVDDYKKILAQSSSPLGGPGMRH
jgi:HlyD family secretion protein